MPDYSSPEISLVHSPLPDERKSITHKFTIGDFKAYLTVGMYNDGKPGEIMITTSKQGSEMSGICHALAISVSIGLQSGIPLERYIEKFKYMRFEPMGMTDNKAFRNAASIMDYIARWLESRFVDESNPAMVGHA